MSASRSSETTVANRYATAIFSLASEGKKLETVVEELSALGRAIAGNAELASVLKNPLIAKEKKAEVMTALAKKADKVTLQALNTIAEQGRADLLPKIAEQLRAKLAAGKGELIAEVESARPLSAAVQKQLADSLSKATGKVVHLNLKENPELLGGVAVQIGSQRLDASLSAALNHMRRELLASNA